MASRKTKSDRNPTNKSHRYWSSLTPRVQARYGKQGVTPAQYNSGKIPKEVRQAARGHRPRPSVPASHRNLPVYNSLDDAIDLLATKAKSLNTGITRAEIAQVVERHGLTIMRAHLENIEKAIEAYYDGDIYKAQALISSTLEDDMPDSMGNYHGIFG